MCYPKEMLEPAVAGPPHVARKSGIMLKKNLGLRIPDSARIGRYSRALPNEEQKQQLSGV